MRPLSTIALAAALLFATVAPASAHPTVELAPTLPTDLTHARTANVDYLGRFPEHFGTAGGRLVDDTFFVTDPHGVYAYDVSAPASPELLGFVPVPQSQTNVALAQEDPDTDGTILVVDGVTDAGPDPLGQLHVIDVSDPAAMAVIGTADVRDHTWNCVSASEEGACDFVYGRSGWIVDLTDPSDPEVLEQGWRDHVPGFGSNGQNSPYTHDLTQIRPGLVMTAGASNVLLDTSDPARPGFLNRLDPPHDFPSLGYHSVEWARAGRAPIAVFGTEIAPANGPGQQNRAGSDCDGEESVIETWDASAIIEALDEYEHDEDAGPEVVQEASFVKLDDYQVTGRDLFVDGGAPGHVLYCAHWMEPHPDFDAGGRLAISYYDRGTRFVEVAGDGTMSDLGWIVAAEGYSGSVQWVGTEDDGSDIAYIMDYRRGMEVVRIGPEPSDEVVHSPVDVIAAGATVTPVAAHGDEGVPSSSLAAVAAAVVLAGVGLGRRRRSARDLRAG